MKTILAAILSFVVLSAVATTVAGQKKSWTEWTKKEAEKMLSSSPWAQIQTDTDTSEMFFQPTSDPNLPGGRRAPNSGARSADGATNQSTNLTFGIRFFSARPVRQAFMRMIQLQQKDLEPEVFERMKNFAEIPASDSIIIAVTIESTDKRSLGKAMQLINSAASGTLKNTTYLERSDGKRLFLQEYSAPGRDGFGARFIFPRMVDEKPFLNTEAGEVRFVSEIGSMIKLNMRFKLADMMLDGKLEY